MTTREPHPPHARIQIVGRGRVGAALAAALPDADWAGRDATGLIGDARSAAASPAEIVLLAVPDSEIHRAAAAIEPGPVVGHLSGATGLGPLISSGHEAFSLHPLLAVTGAATSFAGAFAAVDGSSPAAVAAAESLSEELGMRPFTVAAADRTAYHAAASIAANYLVTVEDFAARLAASVGVPPVAFAPLVRAALTGWEQHGPAGLTGPVSRGDDHVVGAQRLAVAAHLPADLALFDALTAATGNLAARTAAAKSSSGDPEFETKQPL